MNKLIRAAALLLLIISTDSFAQEKTLDRFLQVAKRIGEAFNANNYTPIIDREFNEELKKSLPFPVLQPFLDNIRVELGAITAMGTTTLINNDVGVIPVQFERGILDLQLALDAKGKVMAIYFKEHIPPLVVPEMNNVDLYLPVKGEWFVMWGGEKKEQNYHVDYQNQRHAIDITKLGEDGRKYKTAGKQNEDYFAFGEEIIAPADGIVTDAIDGVRDNEIGSMNQYSAMGNCVVIMHSDSEYSVLAHLKRGSVKVKAGQRVKRGEVIGQCGNSGNSSEPHLHYHLQNTPIFQLATGIKVYFDDVGLKNHPSQKLMPKKYSPVRGDIIYSKD
jgi:hypothetical protein